MQARRSVLTKMFAFVDVWDVSVEGFHLKNKPYSFQISVDYAEVMHVLQAIRNASQLNKTSAWLLRSQVTTHKLSTVHVPVPLDKFVDVSVFHPLRNESKSVFV